MTKDLSKTIMMKSYVKWPSRENFLAFKKAKNKCTSLYKKVKKDYFREATKNGVRQIKSFCKKLFSQIKDVFLRIK